MKNSKNICLFVVIILLVSSLTGFIYGINNTLELDEYISSLSNNNNLFFLHLLYFIIIFISTLSLINIFINSILFCFEGISIGYLISLFYKNYKFKGIIYSLITILINKSIFLLILLYLFIISFNYIKRIIKNMLGSLNDYVKPSLKPLINKFIIALLFLIINDTLIYFFGNMFLNYLTFML